MIFYVMWSCYGNEWTSFDLSRAKQLLETSKMSWQLVYVIKTNNKSIDLIYKEKTFYSLEEGFILKKTENKFD